MQVRPPRCLLLGTAGSPWSALSRSGFVYLADAAQMDARRPRQVSTYSPHIGRCHLHFKNRNKVVRRCARVIGDLTINRSLAKCSLFLLAILKSYKWVYSPTAVIDPLYSSQRTDEREIPCHTQSTLHILSSIGYITEQHECNAVSNTCPISFTCPSGRDGSVCFPSSVEVISSERFDEGFQRNVNGDDPVRDSDPLTGAPKGVEETAGDFKEEQESEIRDGPGGLEPEILIRPPHYGFNDRVSYMEATYGRAKRYLLYLVSVFGNSVAHVPCSFRPKRQSRAFLRVKRMCQYT